MNRKGYVSGSEFLFVMLCMFIVIVTIGEHVHKKEIKKENTAVAKKHSNQEICNIIYIIEGKEKARQPFGIETIECRTFKKCEKICLNTVRNNRVRYKEYGYKKYKTFESFLASRYCPVNQKNWLRMLNYYLKYEE